ncbi:MAG TPA: ABC transporter permease, partial [Candidatus Olsenella avistercoris]|nr:ABC transporter permease [Candidatus Olsenella avistercoris]
LASAVHFNMDAEDLTSLMESYANASQLTYDNNLQTLGYATEDDPAAIQIYPKDFEAKEQVLASIDAYNERQRAAGNEDGVITYTDYMGIIMGSVTDIVNMISLVLIAFVSISLVVSSIMIGIITYISVLERKKEIGILRAIGASKRNVASVFNAETFIEGLISGVFAIAVVVGVSVPVNAWVAQSFAVENIMSLPWQSAAALVCVSVVLTLVAGLIPSSAASRRDPVEALRSE